MFDVPIGAPFAKNATLAMGPSTSVAFAVIAMVAGSVKVVFAAGVTIDTVGGVFGGGMTGAAMPQASSSIMRAYPFSAAVTFTRMRDVVSGANRTCRQTRLLFVIDPP